MEYLLALFLPIVSFFFQVYPRFFNKFFGIDVWKRMIEADLIRKNHHHIPKGLISDGFIIEGHFDYPPIFPWLLSFLSKKTLLQKQGFIAPIFDVIQNLFVYVVTFQITGSIPIALVAQLMYTTIPIAILENSYLTPRSLGYLNFTLAFYFMLNYSVNPQLIFLILGFLFTILIFFTHRFATQSLLFLCSLFTLFDRSLLYLEVFGLSFLAALILSRGYYLRVLTGHYLQIYFWVIHYKNRFSHQIRGLKKEDKKNRDFVGLVYYLLSKFTPITIVATNIWLIGPFLYFLNSVFNIYPVTSQPLVFKMSLWVVSFYILSILVLSFKRLIPIGEGQRYLEMCLAPTAIISAIVFDFFLKTEYKNFAIIIFILIILFNISITIFTQIKGVIEDKNRTLTKDMKKIFTFINKYKNPRVMCIPHYFNLMILFNTKADVLVDIEVKGLMTIQDIYPILKSSLKNLTKKYNLNLLVIRKSYVTLKDLKLPEKLILFENGDIQIINLKKMDS